MKADKQLGQHFLRDAEVLADVAALADVGRSGGALEIGPGEGALTAYLVGTGRPVVALDADPRAIAAVTARLGAQVTAVLGDAVTADLLALAPRVNGDAPVIVGNLPFNVATAIHRRVLGFGTAIARAVFIVQKEVALRMVVRPREDHYGTLTILTAVAAKAHVVRIIPPEAFAPRPKVESATVYIEPRAEPWVPLGELERFGAFLGAGFQHRRKTLGNGRNEPLLAALLAAGATPGQRAEEVGPETWVRAWEHVKATSAGAGEG